MSLHPRRSRAVVASAASLAIAGLLSPAGALALTPTTTPENEPTAAGEPVINEFSASTSGDDLEFLELMGEPQTDYSHLAVLEVEGDAGSDARGSIVGSHPVGSTDSLGLWSADLATGSIQNDTLTLLLVEGYDNQVVLDSDRDGTIDEGLGLTVLDSVAVDGGAAGDLVYSETVLAEAYDGAEFAPGGASRLPDGADTDTTADWVRNAFNKAGVEEGLTPAPGEAWNTPGAPNEIFEAEEPPPVGQCGDPATAIGEVQGEGDATPVPGPVTVEGIVVGDLQEGGFNGFYVQDAGDGNPATSDAVFVYAPGAAEVTVGDQVRVSGTAGEFEGLTQVSGSTIVVCDQGVALPGVTSLEFPLEDADLESVEGMRIGFPASLSILEFFNYGRYGEVVVGTGAETPRQFQPTALADPGSEAAILLRDHNATHHITVDDGLNQQNPAFLRHPAGGQFSLEHSFRGGDTITGLTGVLDYRFDLFRVQPTQDALFSEVNLRPADAPDVGDASMTVASFNVLNYFTTLGSRGAETPEEFERQEAKIVAALAEMDADVVGLIEIENNDDVALSTLTEALNAEVGAGTYEYVATGMVGTDEITTAFIYQPGEVTPVGDFATLTTADDPRFLDDKNRPTLAQTFEENGTGEAVTVAVNHLKSKGSSCDDVGDPEDPWAANCNGVRTDAAEAMVDWLAQDPTGTGVDNTLVIGDLNSYDKEDPIDVFVAGGYTDLLLEHQGEFEYSYVFDGQLGYLDYALANDTLVSKVTGTQAWKINADEPSVLDYDMSFKPDEQDALFEPDAYRSSDHDPVLVGLDLTPVGEPEPVDVDRLAGKDRWETSANMAAEFGAVHTVYLANGVTFPDALTGSAPAVKDGAPVLLTKPDAVPSDIRDALDALNPEEVVVLGGPEAISDAVVEEVEERTGAQVARAAGQERYATAAAIAQSRFDADDVDTVYVASGLEFADSLATGPLAGLEDDPILLSKPGDVPQATAAALEALEPEHIVVLGGPLAIGPDVYAELGSYADTIERLAGEDRYETASAVAQRIAPSEAGFVASGQVFPDALSGAALAGLREAPLLLTRPDHLPQVTGSALVGRDVRAVTVFGGPVAVADDVLREIEALFTQ